MQSELYDHLAATKIIEPDSSMVVAVSGGVDSVVLLDLLSALQAKWGWQIYVAHLDHNLREDSSEDAKLVAKLAENYGHKFYLNQLTAPGPSEAALRRARYAFLESVREGTNSDYIVTAHHADDALETAIFNTIRGADRYGITALRPTRDNIVRPLLPFKKGQLITYAHANNLPFRYDITNNDIRYSRNFIRHNIIPHATTVDPDFKTDGLDIISKLTELTSRIDWQLAQIVNRLNKSKVDGDYELDRASFLQLSEVLQLNILGYITRQLSGGVSISEANLAQGLKFLQNAKTGAASNAIPFLILERVYDSLVVAHKDSVLAYAQQTLPLHTDEATDFGDWRVMLATKPQPTNAANYLVKPNPLYLRGWQAGDRIAPVGMSGHKKVSDIFTDKKVPRRAREHWPMIVDAKNRTLAAVGLAIDRDWLAHPDERHYQLILENL